MKQTELDKLSKEELFKKEKNTKSLMIIFIALILGLLYFILNDYFNGVELNMSILIITICSIGGLISLFPTLKAIQNKLNEKE